MITAYRICKIKYADSAFSGEGAKLYGGRWNEIGTKMIYVAGSLSLATLELLVHIEDRYLIENAYSVAEVRFSEELVGSEVGLPEDWDSDECGFGTQSYGSNWIKSGASAILRVPSVVTKGEVNYLINPDHVDYSKIEIGEMMPYQIDKRLF